MSEEGDPFDSPRLLLSGAKRHMKAFAEQQAAVASAGQWLDPGPGDKPRVRPGFTLPADMKQIAFDLTSNLRAALDHAVFASTHVLTGYDGEGGTKFPFGGDNEKEAREDAKRKCKKVPTAMVEYLLAFEPYRDGNPLLYGLNKLRNTKNHRVLVPMIAGAAELGTFTVQDASVETLKWDAATNSLKTVREPSPNIKPGAVGTYFRLEALIGSGTFTGEPALSLFDRLICEVERVVTGIESETLRIKGS